ncbi:CidA/LrgA family holin-like protein [Aquibacillus halophilus]|uniref:CidA/LrgA family holin-like protein n=1 Tax=Aquibacillus halophilus TaxID=930132 RepID=A0A6A8DAI9_9BACI|nr:CidA/LrgA family holin-like protein [Aquibacillus halophilus]
MYIIYLSLQISILYIFYVIGTWIQEALHLSIPGSIIGMLLLFLLLSMKIVKKEWVELGSSLLVRHLPLLFLPIIVGIINYFDLFAGKGLLLIVITIFSTILVMTSSGLVSQWTGRRVEKNRE